MNISKIADFIFNKKKQSFAVDEIDKKLTRYLSKKNGFFIEAGANDGINQSNTYYFEKYMGWKGILIEPIPELAEKCRKNRPKSIVENYALVPFNYKKKSIKIELLNLMSFVEGALHSKEEEINHIKNACNIQNIQPSSLEVPVITLTEILDKHNVKEIDFFSLDVEGFELSVLKGLNFIRYKPKYILIEARYGEELKAYLQSWYKPLDKLGYYDILFVLN